MADPTQAQPEATTQPTGGQQVAQPEAQPTQERTFTQKELDAIVGERVRREQSKYADYDELKKKAEELEAASKSETEKAVERATKAEERAKKIEAQTRERVVSAEAKAAAAELGFAKPDKAIRLIDLAQAKVDDDGNVSGVREALEALAKEMPELLTKKGAPATGATNPAKGDTSTETDAQRRARLYGGGGSLDYLSKGNLTYYPKAGD